MFFVRVRQEEVDCVTLVKIAPLHLCFTSFTGNLLGIVELFRMWRLVVLRTLSGSYLETFQKKQQRESAELRLLRPRSAQELASELRL